MYPISKPKFDKVILTQGDFKNQGEFITFCYKNNVDGSPSRLWTLFDFSYTISVYVPYGTKVDFSKEGV